MAGRRERPSGPSDRLGIEHETNAGMSHPGHPRRLWRQRVWRQRVFGPADYEPVSIFDRPRHGERSSRASAARPPTKTPFHSRRRPIVARHTDERLSSMEKPEWRMQKRPRPFGSSQSGPRPPRRHAGAPATRVFVLFRAFANHDAGRNDGAVSWTNGSEREERHRSGPAHLEAVSI